MNYQNTVIPYRGAKLMIEGNRTQGWKLAVNGMWFRTSAKNEPIYYAAEFGIALDVAMQLVDEQWRAIETAAARRLE